VQIGVTQLGITVFDNKNLPVANVLYQSLERWEEEAKGRGLMLALRPDGVVFFKTGEGKVGAAPPPRLPRPPPPPPGRGPHPR
jgi:hypothetical protein